MQTMKCKAWYACKVLSPSLSGHRCARDGAAVFLRSDSNRTRRLTKWSSWSCCTAAPSPRGSAGIREHRAAAAVVDHLPSRWGWGGWGRAGQLQRVGLIRAHNARWRDHTSLQRPYGASSAGPARGFRRIDDGGGRERERENAEIFGAADRNSSSRHGPSCCGQAGTAHAHRRECVRPRARVSVYRFVVFVRVKRAR